TFNYRGNPLVQQAREMIARDEIGPVHFVHGDYLQDWLLETTDFSWRLEPEKGGASSAIGDIGSHWCDLVQHVIGQRVVEVLAELTTVIETRMKPAASPEAFARGDGAREPFTVRSEDLATVLLRFDGGAKGSMSVGQVCAGHKNDLWFEAAGDRRPPAFATFEDGYRAAAIVDAMLESHRRGGVWTKVDALVAART